MGSVIVVPMRNEGDGRPVVEEVTGASLGDDSSVGRGGGIKDKDIVQGGSQVSRLVNGTDDGAVL